MSASAVVIHYEEALYQVYAPLYAPLLLPSSSLAAVKIQNGFTLWYWLAQVVLKRRCETRVCHIRFSNWNLDLSGID